MNREYFEKISNRQEVLKKELQYWVNFVPSGGLGHYAKNIKIETITEKLEKIESKLGDKYVVDFNELLELIKDV